MIGFAGWTARILLATMMNTARLALALLIVLAAPLAAAEDPFSGKWTYRSYHNKPLVMIPDDDHAGEVALSLIFGEGIITLEAPVGESIRGVLDLGANYQLDLAGTVKGSAPAVVELTGTGRDGTPTAGWEYRYAGFLVPKWEQGVRQVPSLVGSVLRSKQHGNSLPGYSTSFIAVKRPEGAIVP